MSNLKSWVAAPAVWVLGDAEWEMEHYSEPDGAEMVRVIITRGGWDPLLRLNLTLEQAYELGRQLLDVSTVYSLD
jgi:hypothetical protein